MCRHYDVHIGISLAVQDPVGQDAHEIEYWEVSNDWPPAVSTARDVYESFLERLTERSSDGSLPFGTPAPDREFEMKTNFKGNGGYIHFVQRDLIMKPIDARHIQTMTVNSGH
jgi:hypothetical protein